MNGLVEGVEIKNAGQSNRIVPISDDEIIGIKLRTRGGDRAARRNSEYGYDSHVVDSLTECLGFKKPNEVDDSRRVVALQC